MDFICLDGESSILHFDVTSPWMAGSSGSILWSAKCCTDDILESVTFDLDLFYQKLLFLVSKKFEADQRLCFFQILGSLFYFSVCLFLCFDDASEEDKPIFKTWSFSLFYSMDGSGISPNFHSNFFKIQNENIFF